MTTYELRNHAGEVVGSADSLDDAVSLMLIGPSVVSITLPGSTTPIVSAGATPWSEPAPAPRPVHLFDLPIFGWAVSEFDR